MHHSYSAIHKTLSAVRAIITLYFNALSAEPFLILLFFLKIYCNLSFHSSLFSALKIFIVHGKPEQFQFIENSSAFTVHT